MKTTQKKLIRLPKQGQIAGVCAGLAEYLEIDVTLVRVVFVLLGFVTAGFMILIYVILAIIVPVDEASSSRSQAQAADNTTFSEKAEKLGRELQDNNRADRLRNYFGVGLLVVGIWVLLQQFFPLSLNLDWKYIWPILLILSGFFILLKRRA